MSYEYALNYFLFVNKVKAFFIHFVLCSSNKLIMIDCSNSNWVEPYEGKSYGMLSQE